MIVSKLRYQNKLFYYYHYHFYLFDFIDSIFLRGRGGFGIYFVHQILGLIFDRVYFQENYYQFSGTSSLLIASFNFRISIFPSLVNYDKKGCSKPAIFIATNKYTKSPFDFKIHLFQNFQFECHHLTFEHSMGYGDLLFMFLTLRVISIGISNYRLFIIVLFHLGFLWNYVSFEGLRKRTIYPFL